MTRNEAVHSARERLVQAGIDSAVFDAAELCCYALGITKAELIADGRQDVPFPAKEALLALTNKRAAGYPLQYLLGEWEFYGRTFAVGEGVLIPRQDTETLCSQVISFVRDKEAVVLDLCSGSGCIAVTVALECQNSRVYAVEKSEQAYPYLKRNIVQNHASVKAFLRDALDICTLELIPDCDVIVSNPPYLTDADMDMLQREVSYEPADALYGGEDGLAFYRELTALWKRKLKPGGRLFYELGAGQEQAVSEILQENGLKSVCETPDLCGIIRVISAGI